MPMLFSLSHSLSESPRPQIKYTHTKHTEQWWLSSNNTGNTSMINSPHHPALLLVTQHIYRGPEGGRARLSFLIPVDMIEATLLHSPIPRTLIHLPSGQVLAALGSSRPARQQDILQRGARISIWQRTKAYKTDSDKLERSIVTFLSRQLCWCCHTQAIHSGARWEQKRQEIKIVININRIQQPTDKGQ